METKLSKVQENIFIARYQLHLNQILSLSPEPEDKLIKHIWLSFRNGELTFTCLHWTYTLEDLDLAPCSEWVCERLLFYAAKVFEAVKEQDFDPETGRATVEKVEGHFNDDQDFDEDGLVPLEILEDEHSINNKMAIPTINVQMPSSMYNMNRGIRTLESKIPTKKKQYEVARNRSRAYSRDLKNGYVGTMAYRALGDPLIEAGKRLHALTASDILTKKRKATIYVIAGRGGSKKSADLKEWSHTYLNRDSNLRNRGAVTIICPTNHLRAEWIRAMDTQWTYMIKTLETALFEVPNSVVIADDASKFPAGYFDSLLVLHPQIKVLILTLDITQLGYKSPNPNSETNFLEGEGDRFAKFADYYYNFTYRTPQALARRFGITSYNLDEGVFDPQPHPYIETGAIIVPGTQQELDLIENGREAYTYSNSQGLDFDEVHVVIDRNSHTMDYRALNTAYTRAKHSLHVHNYATDLELPLYAALFLAADNSHMVEFMTNEIKKKMPKAMILNEDPRLNKKMLRERYGFEYTV